ncbi:MAG TPA: GNAT family N-acetyltransferase [Magnetospirillum sp.]|nr:GNAT family N-acetyltransferase [Magnetospirillum sp.]
MDFDLRFGQEADAPLIADLVIEAGAGLFESMLDGIVPGVDARHFVRMAINGEDSPLRFDNAILAEVDGKVAGMALGYPSSEYGLHPLLKSLLPNRRLKPLAELFASKVPDSWYLNSLVVLEHARGKGLGRLLVQFCADLATEEGLSSMSLHAWADNDAALRVYRGLGFADVERVPVSLRTQPERDSGMVLMKAALPLAG